MGDCGYCKATGVEVRGLPYLAGIPRHWGSRIPFWTKMCEKCWEITRDGNVLKGMDIGPFKEEA